jgi:hypothetical protein
VQSADAGDYTVIVSNTMGGVTSNTAKLILTGDRPVNKSAGGGAAGAWFHVTLALLVAVHLAARRTSLDARGR